MRRKYEYIPNKQWWFSFELEGETRYGTMEGPEDYWEARDWIRESLAQAFEQRTYLHVHHEALPEEWREREIRAVPPPPERPWRVLWGPGMRQQGYILARSEAEARGKVRDALGAVSIERASAEELPEAYVRSLSSERVTPLPLVLTHADPAPRIRKDVPTGLTVIGIVVNPKLRTPLLATFKDSDVGIRHMDEEDWPREGTGHFESSCDDDSDYGWSCAATDCVRVHTPRGVQHKGAGYGTSLYAALALASYLHKPLKLDLGSAHSCISSSSDSRSADASEWWDGAVRRDLAERRTVEGAEQTYESYDARDELSDRVEGETISADDGPDWTVRYVRRLTVDMERAGPDREADVLEYGTVWDKGIAIAELVMTPDDYGGKLDDVWQAVRDGRGIVKDVNLTAILALDVRDLTVPAMNLLGMLATKAGATDEQLDGLRLRWEHGLDPEEEPRQLRLKINAAGAREAERALLTAAEARDRVPWDDLAELP